MSSKRRYLSRRQRCLKTFSRNNCRYDPIHSSKCNFDSWPPSSSHEMAVRKARAGAHGFVQTLWRMRLLSGIALALVGMVLLPPCTEAFRLGGPSPSLPQTRVGAAPSMRSGAGTAFQLLPGRALLGAGSAGQFVRAGTPMLRPATSRRHLARITLAPPGGRCVSRSLCACIRPFMLYSCKRHHVYLLHSPCGCQILARKCRASCCTCCVGEYDRKVNNVAADAQGDQAEHDGAAAQRCLAARAHARTRG